jgi:SAM-dependent methyltransferase
VEPAPLGHPPPFPGTDLHSWDEYQRHRNALETEYRRRRDIEAALAPANSDPFDIEGFCAVCAKTRSFRVSYSYAYDRTESGRLLPNWREHLVCDCGFNNRVRASLHYFLRNLEPRTDSRLYITEQTTPLHAWLKARYPNTVGSEYLGPDVPSGSERDGYRHEDLTRLSFGADTFDAILSFDVLEHVPDSEASFRECLRCLKPGGVLLFSAPFTINQTHHTIRAVQQPDGSIDHLLLPPEFHGNPIDPAGGSLCFRYFGWDLLPDLDRYGFQEPAAVVYWSQEYGYLGGEQVLFVARKAI